MLLWSRNWKLITIYRCLLSLYWCTGGQILSWSWCFVCKYSYTFISHHICIYICIGIIMSRRFSLWFLDIHFPFYFRENKLRLTVLTVRYCGTKIPTCWSHLWDYCVETISFLLRDWKAGYVSLNNIADVSQTNHVKSLNEKECAPDKENRSRIHIVESNFYC